MPALPSLPTLGRAMKQQILTDMPNIARPLEYFGGVAVPFNTTPVNNMTAFNEAMNWTATTGGKVFLGAGVYGVDGTVSMQSYMNIIGLHRTHSIVRQMAASPVDTFTSTSAANSSIAFASAVDFSIHGGWTVNWETDITTMTAAGIRFAGANTGPTDPVAFGRESVTSLTDPFHNIRGMRFLNIPGTAVVTSGRGEIVIANNEVWRCARNGFLFGAPDCWIYGNTVYATGDTGTIIASGNQRVYGNKNWFNGMHSGVEVAGAGVHVSGAGTQNITINGDQTQDTWGPGFIDDGKGTQLIGCLIDEPAGGRLTQQGRGFAGTRSAARAFIRLTTSQHPQIKATINGGGRNGPANFPFAVDFASAGANHGFLDLTAAATDLNVGLITATAGYNNAKRHNLVRINGGLVHGRRTPAELADATHHVNLSSAVTEALLTDGSVAYRVGTDWLVHAHDSVVTPA